MPVFGLGCGQQTVFSVLQSEDRKEREGAGDHNTVAPRQAQLTYRGGQK